MYIDVYMAKRRTQLYLDEAQMKVLAAQSRKTGKSVGQLVREAVDETYRKKEPRERRIAPDDPLLKFIAGARPTVKETDISERLDYYLYEEFELNRNRE
jgi:hypothetical protein